MSLHENLKLFRDKEGLSQEKMAEKLGYSSINGYANVERGKVMPSASKLKKIAQILETDLETLLGSDNSHVVNIKGNNHHYHSVILLSESECVHELEKARLQLEIKDKELAMQQREIAYLKELLAMHKREKP